MGLIKKLRKAKKEAPPNEKPTVVKTHLRDMIIVPEMIGSVVGIYNGKVGARVVGKGEVWILRFVYRSSTLSKSSPK
jgi:ribosomal protein S19